MDKYQTILTRFYTRKDEPTKIKKHQTKGSIADKAMICNLEGQFYEKFHIT